jgi:hypothetical protein
MKRAIFVVEGETEKKLVESSSFKKWLEEECGIIVTKTPKKAICDGNGNMCAYKIQRLAELIRQEHSPDLIIVLADLDRDKSIQSITDRKNKMKNTNVDLIIIARNALEAWFLADTEAIRSWRGKGYEKFRVEEPEVYSPPWNEIIALSKVTKRPLSSKSSKPDFAEFFIKQHKFDIERAAEHKRCPSAKYCVDKLKKLGKEGAS